MAEVISYYQRPSGSSVPPPLHGRDCRRIDHFCACRDHKLAPFIFAHHAHWTTLFRDVERDIATVSVEYYGGDAQYKIHKLGREIFRYWWQHNEAEERWGNRQTIHHALVRGKIDISSVVGHWKVREKHRMRKLPNYIKDSGRGK